MQQNKTQIITTTNQSLNEKGLNLSNLRKNTPFGPLPSPNKLSEADKALNKAKRNIAVKKYFAAKNQLIKVFEEKKTIEIVLLISECFTKLREFKKAVKFFEKHLVHFEDVGHYWGVLALHNYASEDFEGAAGASFNALEKQGLGLLELWKVFINASKKIERGDVIYKICKKHLPDVKTTSFDDITSNPYLIEGYLASSFEQNQTEGWEFVKQSGISLKNVEKFGEMSGMICSAIASLIPDNREKTKMSLSWLTKAKELDPKNHYIRWNLSHAQLTAGELKEGIKNYETRFFWDKFPSYNRTFKKPRWNPNVPQKARILVWYEQGIGDQIRFMSAISHFKTKYPNLVIETGERTFELIKEAFKDVEVRISTMNTDLTTSVEDFDYHIPSGSLFFHMVGENSKILNRKNSWIFPSFLVPDELRKQFWARKLASQTSKPKIGICWTSGLNNSKRNKNYSTLEKWEPLLSHDDFSFVSLQYNLSMDELLSKGKIAKNFLNTGFLDQKDDLDGVIALISNLDYVISTSSSPSMFASALGIPTTIFSLKNLDFLGRTEKFEQHPIFEKSTYYPVTDAEDDEYIVSDLIKLLERKFLNKSQ